MVIAKMQMPPDEATYADRLETFQELGREIDQHANAARKLINSIIADPSTPSDNAALARIETRIEIAATDLAAPHGRRTSEFLGRSNAQDFDEAPGQPVSGDRVAARRIHPEDRCDPRRHADAGVLASAGNVIRDQKRRPC